MNLLISNYKQLVTLINLRTSQRASIKCDLTIHFLSSLVKQFFTKNHQNICKDKKSTASSLNILNCLLHKLALFPTNQTKNSTHTQVFVPISNLEKYIEVYVLGHCKRKFRYMSKMEKVDYYSVANLFYNTYQINSVQTRPIFYPKKFPKQFIPCNHVVFPSNFEKYFTFSNNTFFEETLKICGFVNYQI